MYSHGLYFSQGKFTYSSGNHPNRVNERPYGCVKANVCAEDPFEERTSCPELFRPPHAKSKEHCLARLQKGGGYVHQIFERPPVPHHHKSCITILLSKRPISTMIVPKLASYVYRSAFVETGLLPCPYVRNAPQVVTVEDLVAVDLDTHAFAIDEENIPFSTSQSPPQQFYWKICISKPFHILY